MNNFEKGSEWGKWDLQACTREYTAYKGITLEKEQVNKLKELTKLESNQIQSDHKNLTDKEYAKLYVEYLVNFTDLTLVGIANHNTGKGLQSILNYLENKQQENDYYKKLTILPGVEIGGADRCHIVIIFNINTNNSEIFNYDNEGNILKKINWDDYIEKFLDVVKIPKPRIEHSKPKNSSDLSAKLILDLADKWDFIPIFPHICNGDGWWSELQDSNKKETFNHINFGIVDIKTIKKNQDLKTILDGKKEEYGSKIIAQIYTSDASSLTEIGKQYTWIKANPTFEGLRQIMFEPVSRVKTQSDKPEVKKDSDVIESVRFESDCKLFISNPIYLNQNLNVIIGGKSTGKSLLLHSISKVFAKHDKKIKYDYQYNLIVKYKDNKEYSLENKPERLIEYISQGYLQELVTNDKSSHNEFTKLINDSLKENENYLELSNDFNAKNTELKKTITLEINKFLSKKDDIKEKTEDFKKLGDIEAKKSELQINLDSIEKTKSESTLTDAGKLEFQSLQSIKADLISKGKSKRQVETYLLELRELLVQENLKNSLEQKKTSFSQNLLTTDESLIN